MADDNRDLAVADRVERWLPAVVVVSALTGFSVLAWYAYHAGTQSTRDEDLLVVEAEKTPMKEKPLDPGGMKFPNQDKTIFETFAGGNNAPAKVERVLPMPEEPIAKDDDANGTKTWVNKNLHKTTTDATRLDGSMPVDAPRIEAVPEQVIGGEEKMAAKNPTKEGAVEGFIHSSVKPEEKKTEAAKMVDASNAAEKLVNEKAAAAKAAEQPASWEEAEKNAKTIAEPPASQVAAVVEIEEKPAPPPEIAAPKPVEKPAPAPVAEKPAATPAKSGNYKVQLGAYRSEKEASEAAAKIMRKFPEANGHAQNIVRADLGEKGIYYRLRLTGFATTAEAKSFCATLSAKSQPCLIPKE